MKRFHVRIALAIGFAGAIGIGSVAVAGGGDRSHPGERLTGFEEVPALATSGSGDFRAATNRSRDEIRYRLSFRNLESDVTQSHIHFENATNNGPVVVFLCTNLGNGPAGTQPCPAGGGTITGTIRAADVGAGAAGAGIEAGEFADFLRAIDAGSTYVNVHTTGRPGGEIRAQLHDGHHHDRD